MVETLAKALSILKKEIREFTISMEEEGFTNAYRLQLAESFFYKFYLHVATECGTTVDSKIISAAKHDIRPLSVGKQEYTEYPEMYPLTKPIIRRNAFVQATGVNKIYGKT